MTTTDLLLGEVQKRMQWLRSELDTLTKVMRLAAVARALERLHEAGIEAAVLVELDGTPRDEGEGAVYVFIRDASPARLEAADKLLRELDRFEGVWLLLASKYAVSDESARFFDERHLAWSAELHRVVLTPICQPPVGKLKGE